MLSALYYPHTTLSANDVTSLRLLKRALLMWDHLEFIVPHPRFKGDYSDSLVAEAIEVIGKNHYPNEEEKRGAHERIEELITRPHLPDVFRYQGTDRYEVYPQKFLPETWELLLDSKHAGELLPNDDYPVSNQLGLTIMAILADCCAGETRSRVTDRGLSYASLSGLLVTDEDSVRNQLLDADLRSLLGEESLISLRLTLPDIDKVSLDQLIKFRKREEVENGHTLRELRHNYVNRLEAQIREITSNSKLTQSDLEEIERQYFQASLDDFVALKSELGFEFGENVTKNVVISVLAGAGTLAATYYPQMAPIIKGVYKASGAPLTIGGVISTRNKYNKARTDILRKHPMALLYELRD